MIGVNGAIGEFHKADIAFARDSELGYIFAKYRQQCLNLTQGAGVIPEGDAGGDKAALA